MSYPNTSGTTVLSKYIRDLKDSDTDFSIKWSIVTRAISHRGNPSRCYLCLMEKLCILFSDKSTLLNKRSELITKCRHENKFYPANQKRDRFTHPPWVSLNLIPPPFTAQSDDRFVLETRVTVLQFLSWISISLCMYLHRALLLLCETLCILVYKWIDNGGLINLYFIHSHNH